MGDGGRSLIHAGHRRMGGEVNHEIHKTHERKGGDDPLIASLVASGRYNNSSEVVRAGLRILDAVEKSLAIGSFPSGAMRHLYTKTDNRAERRTAKASPWTKRS